MTADGNAIIVELGQFLRTINASIRVYVDPKDSPVRHPKNRSERRLSVTVLTKSISEIPPLMKGTEDGLL
jgi:hypothetical protein